MYFQFKNNILKKFNKQNILFNFELQSTFKKIALNK
ncbi:hypothetical protein CLV00_2718 [Flavobacterium sp. 11]|nr:hypothetical protein CLV00_2718 [Flavobacterium sp. 11]